MADDTQRPWTVLSSSYSYRDEWLRLRSDTVQLPNGTVLTPFHTLEVPNSVNVIAITAQNSIVLISQYRHAVRQVSLEIPAGNIDAGETPMDAAKRELLEETGFAGGQWHPLGATFPFSSRLNSTVYGFLALGVERERAPQLDSGEFISVAEMPWKDFASRLHGVLPILREGNQLAMAWLAKHHMEARRATTGRRSTARDLGPRPRR